MAEFFEWRFPLHSMREANGRGRGWPSFGLIAAPAWPLRIRNAFAATRRLALRPPAAPACARSLPEGRSRMSLSADCPTRCMPCSSWTTRHCSSRMQARSRPQTDRTRPRQSRRRGLVGANLPRGDIVPGHLRARDIIDEGRERAGGYAQDAPEFLGDDERKSPRTAAVTTPAKNSISSMLPYLSMETARRRAACPFATIAESTASRRSLVTYDSAMRIFASRVSSRSSSSRRSFSHASLAPHWKTSIWGLPPQSRGQSRIADVKDSWTKPATRAGQPLSPLRADVGSRFAFVANHCFRWHSAWVVASFMRFPGALGSLQRQHSES